MPVLFKYSQPLLGVWKIEETSEELLLMLDLRSEYQSFLQHITAEKRRREWLATRVLLKELAGKELLIAYHADGAPYLPECFAYEWICRHLIARAAGSRH